MYGPHAFVKNPYDKQICALCRRGLGASIHLYSIPGIDPVAAENERSMVEAQELTEEMRKPLADISGKSGKMEREAPLFFGTGDNPGLF